MEYNGKRLLILGGAFQHCKVVEAAHEMGITVYVTDYLDNDNSPAKQIADKAYMFDVKDVDGIVDMCKQEKIDGILSVCLDICQRPYQQLCERLHMPCYGTRDQFLTLTDKTKFKEACLLHGVDVVPEYRESDFEEDSISPINVDFPVLVKPNDSRGSRGSTVCNTKKEVQDAIKAAKDESSNGQVLIEKYMGNKNDICVTYLIINGNTYLTRVGDRVLGRREDKMERVSALGMAPSRYIEMYVNNVHQRVSNMLKNIGLINAPVFMQGFVDGDTVRFYDPGLRYPGAEYERMFERVFGINLIKPLIEFALTGEMLECNMPENGYLLKGKVAPYLLISLRPGKIKCIKGEEAVRNHPTVVSMFTRYKVGDTIGEHFNVNQRFCEIDIVCDNNAELKQVINWIYKTLIVENENGENMVFSIVDTENIFRD